MCRIAHSRFALFTRVAIGAFLLMPVVLVPGQDVTEPALKAAYVYNFAKFTVWPPDVLPASATFVICVLGDATVAEELTRAVRSRELAGHRIAVSQVSATGPQQTCHILYVSGIPSVEAARIVAGLRGVPVLTVSDVEGFNGFGGMAQVFFENGQLRFSFNYESAKRARLQISAKLLALGKSR